MARAQTREGSFRRVDFGHLIHTLLPDRVTLRESCVAYCFVKKLVKVEVVACEKADCMRLRNVSETLTEIIIVLSVVADLWKT